MTPPRPAHGCFDLRCANHVLVIRSQGSFNREGAEALNRAAAELWRAHCAPEHWGMLIDLREWEGATAEGYKVAHELRRWAVAHHCAAAAWVFGNAFIRKMAATGMALVAHPYPVEFFNDVAAANAWLQTQGLGPVDEA